MNFSRLVFFGVLLFAPSQCIATQWAYSQKVDEFSDTSVTTARTNAIKSRGYVIARCDEKSRFDIIFSVGAFIGMDDRYHVRYRVDKSPVQMSKWLVSTEGTSIFVSRLDKVFLARKMLNGGRLLLEVKDFHGTPHKAVYSLKGSSNAIGRVLDICHIKREQIKVKGVGSLVMKEISTWGNKNRACNKKMLVSLGYGIEGASSNKTEELYLVAQKYVNHKYTIQQKYTDCSVNRCFSENEKGKFLHEIYEDAIYKNEEFKALCGHLRLGD